MLVDKFAYERLHRLLSYSCKLELCGDGVLRVRIDRAQHAPSDATTRSTAVKECWVGSVDGQVPGWELRRTSVSMRC